MNESDLALTKFAMGMKLLTLDQVQKCVDLQRTLEVPMSTIFIGKKFITEEQFDQLLEKVKNDQQRKDIIFAKVTLALRYLTQEQLVQIQQDQENSETAETLGDFILLKGILKQEQINTIFANVKATKIMLCSGCQKKYSMTPYQSHQTYTCTVCKANLALTEEEQIEQILREKFSWTDESSSVVIPDAIPESTELTEKDILGTTETVTEDSTKILARDIFTQRPNTTTQPKVEQIHFMGSAKDLQLKLAQHKQDELCGTKMGDYQILERIGAGAMGVVYKAEQIRLQRVVAIKMLNPSLCGDDFYVKRFMVEARSAAKLNHPNIVQIYDADICDGRLFYSMEYIRGETISSVMERKPKLPPKNCLDIILQIAHALVETYESGIVHRDIKPENILLTVKGIAKLADLGLARNVDYAKEMEAQESGMVMGTPYYVAPEQITTPNVVDCRTDIYSLGTSCYAMITGEIPFRHPDPRVVLMRVIKNDLKPVSEIDTNIPPSLSWVISKMVEKKPNERFQTPLELIEVLEGLQSNLAESRTNILTSEMPTTHNFYDSNLPLITSDTPLKITPDTPLSDPNPPSQLKTASIQPPSSLNTHSAPLTFSDESAVTQGFATSAQPQREPAKRSSTREESPKRTLNKTEEHRIMPLRSTGRHVSRSFDTENEEKDSPWSLIGGICFLVLAVGLIAWVIFSGDNKPTKPNNIPTNTATIEAEKETVAYNLVMEQIQSFLINPEFRGNEENHLKTLITDFCNNYPKSSKNNELQQRLIQIEEVRKERDADVAYTELHNFVEELLEIPNFQKALQAVQDKKNLQYGQDFAEKLNRLEAEIHSKSQEHWEKLNKQIDSLTTSCNFASAIRQLQAGLEIYIGQSMLDVQQKLIILEQKQMSKTKEETILRYRKLLLDKTENTQLIKENKFSEARNFLNIIVAKEGSQQNTNLTQKEIEQKKEAEKAAITVLNKEFEDLDELLGKRLIQALEHLQKKQQEFKKDFLFEFSDRQAIGKINRIELDTNRIYIFLATGGVKNAPIKNMTWNCKRKILDLFKQENLNTQSRIHYLLVMYELYDIYCSYSGKSGDKLIHTSNIASQIKVAPIDQKELCQAIHIHFLVLELQRQTDKKALKEMSAILKQLQSQYANHITWQYLRNQIAKDIANEIANNPSLKREWSKLFYKQDFKSEIFSDFK